MKNFILFTFLFVSFYSNAQYSTSTFKNRAISNKNYVINDRVDTYSFRGVFTLNKKELIQNTIERIVGLPKYYGTETIWNLNNSTISLSTNEVKLSLGKVKDSEFYYYKMQELEKELIDILDKPGPKNIAISNKSYILNDNVSIYSLKAVFHQRKNSTIKELIELQFGKPKKVNQEFVWGEQTQYTIILKESDVKINFAKSKDDEFYYNKVKTLGNEIINIVN